MLSATFVAVPAFNLVDPARISGPTESVISRSTVAAIDDRGWPGQRTGYSGIAGKQNCFRA